MKLTRSPQRFLLLGVALGSVWWLAESALHAWVFGSLPFRVTLLGEHDPNELWMRAVVVLLIAGLGHVADRAVLGERDRRRRTEHLLALATRIEQASVEADGAGALAPIEGSEESLEDEGIAGVCTAAATLQRALTARRVELGGLLALAGEIGSGRVLDEILDRTWLSLKHVLPYDRLGVALLEGEPPTVRAVWARSDRAIEPARGLPTGYVTRLEEGSSLHELLRTGRPRILNDLEVYLQAHPASESTRRALAEGIRSSLTCPLVAGGEPVGFLFFSSHQADTYRDAHVRLFQLIATHVAAAVERARLMDSLREEHREVERLLHNAMPRDLAQKLRAHSPPLAKGYTSATVVFIDIVGFTPLARSVSPQELVTFLHTLFSAWDTIGQRHGIEKIKTIGDAWMGAAGLSPGSNTGAAAHAVLAILKSATAITRPDGERLRLRAGLHVGPAIGGVIGRTRYAFDLWGDTVNMAARLEAAAEPGTVLISREARASLGDGFELLERGELLLAGIGPRPAWVLTAGPD